MSSKLADIREVDEQMMWYTSTGTIAFNVPINDPSRYLTPHHTTTSHHITHESHRIL